MLLSSITVPVSFVVRAFYTEKKKRKASLIASGRELNLVLWLGKCSNTLSKKKVKRRVKQVPFCLKGSPVPCNGLERALAAFCRKKVKTYLTGRRYVHHMNNVHVCPENSTSILIVNLSAHGELPFEMPTYSRGEKALSRYFYLFIWLLDLGKVWSTHLEAHKEGLHAW